MQLVHLARRVLDSWTEATLAGAGSRSGRPSRGRGHLLDDLVLEVPRRGSAGSRAWSRATCSGAWIGMPAPGQVAALLVRAAVDHVLDEVGADPAVVQERVALRRRAVGRRRARPSRWRRSRNSQQRRAWCRGPARRSACTSRASVEPGSRARASTQLPRRAGLVVRLVARRARRRSAASRRAWGAPRRRRARRPCAAKIRSTVSSEKYEKCSW